MLRRTLTILSLIGLLLSVGLWGFASSGCCPSTGSSDCIYIPLTIDGCPDKPVTIGDSFELTVSAAGRLGVPAFMWWILTEEGLKTVPNEEVEITDIGDGVTMTTIAVVPKQVGTTTLTVGIVTFDSTNLADPPTCTFESGV